MHVHTKRKPLRDAWCLVVLDVSGRQGGWRSWHVPLIYFLLLSQEWEKKYLWTLCYSKVHTVCSAPTYNPFLSLDQEWASVSRLTQLADCDFVCLAKRWVWVISSSERLFWHSTLSFLSSSHCICRSTPDSPRRAKTRTFWKCLSSLQACVSSPLFNLFVCFQHAIDILHVMADVFLTTVDSETSSLTQG